LPSGGALRDGKGGPSVRAEIIAVGTELLLGQIANTNAQFLSEQLALAGVSVYFHTVVGDNKERLRSALSIAAGRSDLIVLSGGLGPTDDDVTREAVAEHVGRRLVLDETILHRLRELFAGFNMVMPENNRRQAMVIEGGLVLDNPRGTAPGMYVKDGSRHYVLLPGPPTELRPMVREKLLPLVQSIAGPVTIRSRVLRLYGIGESPLEERLKDILDGQSNPTIAPLASEGEVMLRLTARAVNEEEAYRLIAPVEQQIRERVGKYIYGVDDEILPVAVGKRLASRNQTLAVAESCTGGLVGASLTEVPGSSSYFRMGIVTYSNASKHQLLGVSAETIRVHGAVSEETAREMAEKIRILAGTDWGLSVTGIAGPGGGTPEKPVGLVYTAVSGPEGVRTKRLLLRGDRQQIRIRSVKAALFLLITAMDPETKQ
jgi:nicotinamide-nucleotide amidase